MAHMILGENQVKLLHEGIGHTVTCELKTGARPSGRLGEFLAVSIDWVCKRELGLL